MLYRDCRLDYSRLLQTSDVASAGAKPSPEPEQGGGIE
jgi:hypothetical protein